MLQSLVISCFFFFKKNTLTQQNGFLVLTRVLLWFSPQLYFSSQTSSLNQPRSNLLSSPYIFYYYVSRFKRDDRISLNPAGSDICSAKFVWNPETSVYVILLFIMYNDKPFDTARKKGRKEWNVHITKLLWPWYTPLYYL